MDATVVLSDTSVALPTFLKRVEAAAQVDASFSSQADMLVSDKVPIVPAQAHLQER